jgi:hypothetical protein
MEEDMKTTKSLTKKAMVIVTGASLMVLAFAGTVPAAGGSLQETEAVWGNPVAIQKMDNGVEKRFYKNSNTMDVGFRYFSYKDGKVIAEGLDRNAPIAQKVEKDGVPASTLSSSNQNVSAKDLDQFWGKPALVRPLANGTEERYYKIQNTMDTGYRVFQIKGGKVVASGMAGLPVVNNKTELKGIPVGFLADSSAGTVAEVESVWGSPVGVKKLANGTEERYYKYNNTLSIGSRMFLFKDGKAVATAVANN